MNKSKIKEVLNNFKNVKILVIGDIMVDKFVWGKVSRISPEAPVPVVEVVQETYMPGGAGNVVNNICSLHGRTALVGLIGGDLVGQKLLEELHHAHVDTTGVLIDSKRPTIVKTRIIAQHQQIVRFDKETKDGISSKFRNKILGYLESIIPVMDGIIISDYGKGMIYSSILERVIKKANIHKKPVVVDPHVRHFSKYKNVTCITPNRHEACMGMLLPETKSQNDIIILGKKIMRKLKCASLLITQGEDGMTLFEKTNRITHIPSFVREVYDVSGAGDTVIAVLCMALACGIDILDASYLANYAAGVVVEKLGTATLTIDELKEAIYREQ